MDSILSKKLTEMREEIIKRLNTLIFVRALVITIMLGSFYTFRIVYDRLLHPTAFSYFIASLYLLTIIYAIALRWINNDFRFVVFTYTQIIIDVIAETILICLTGGIESWFVFLYPLSIVSASILLNRRACYIIATASSIFYGVLVDLQLYDIIPISVDSFFTEKDYLYNIFAHITAFYLIAFLSGYLSERLQTTTQTLKEKNTILNDLKAFSRDIIESMPSGVFTTNLNRKIITFNTSAQRITHLSIDEVIGKTPEEIFPFLKDTKDDPERVEGEITVDGKTTHIGIRFSTLQNSSGKPIGMIGIFQDLTELKALEAEVKKKEKWAFIGELSALIAHELRNPLASLKASIETLCEKKVSGEHAERLMNIAISEMERLNKIITDFLLYAKPQGLSRMRFDLHQSLKDIITILCSSERNRKDVKITADLPGELFIIGDSKQLHQVFWNLSINAIEAIPETGSINISTRKKADMIEVIFRDSGIGINREEMDKIFYPFFTTKEEGTGLGLSIAQRIVEDHGGRIKVESDGKGKGTTITVILPQGDI